VLHTLSKSWQSSKVEVAALRAAHMRAKWMICSNMDAHEWQSCVIAGEIDKSRIGWVSRMVFANRLHASDISGDAALPHKYMLSYKHVYHAQECAKQIFAS
jgi:hypothetical protein